MHYLQMALEKAAKAYFWHGDGTGQTRSRINRRHNVVEKQLPSVYLELYRRQTGGHRPLALHAQQLVRQLCGEVDLLAPAVTDEGQRPDNCEYPWESVDGDVTVAVHSPLDREFAPTWMVKTPEIVTFLKAIHASLTSLARAS